MGIDRTFEEIERPEDDPVMRALAELGPHVDPPDSLRDRVMARFRADTAGAVEAGGISIVPGGSGEWDEAPVPGIWFRVLHSDEEARRRTMLVRMDPGASYPAHVHSDDEECLVLQGDLIVEELGDRGSHRMSAGDYQIARGGSRHGVQRTETGCLLLIRDSLDDVLEVA